MTHVRYTREMLSEAVAASTSMAGVMRHLGLRQTGGAHAHLRRRITTMGIDTAHFLGSAHYRGTHSLNRLSADQILILRPATANRAKPHTLRRALLEIGRPYLCAECGIGDSWNGRPLVLHVDHIDGRLWDCRAENLRFLCPNCHSQTQTFAGRTSKQNPAALVQVDADGNPVTDAPPPTPLTDDEVLELIRKVERREIRPSQAAKLVGCTRGQIYKLQKRLAERGSVAPAKQKRPPLSTADRQTVLAFALAHPELGLRRTAEAMSRLQPAPIIVSPTTVAKVLEEANVSTEQRRAAAAAKAKAPITV
jgi:hypothetical protein